MNKRLLRSLLSLMVCMAMLLSLTPAALAESADAPSTEMAALKWWRTASSHC